MSQQLESTLRLSGALTSQELEISLSQANAQKISLWDLLIEQRRLPEDTVAEGFSSWLSLPRVRLDSAVIQPSAVKAVGERLARKHTCVPVRLTAKSLVLAMANPLDRTAIEEVAFASSREVQPVVASRAEILVAIDKHYGTPVTAEAGGGGGGLQLPASPGSAASWISI